jgi:hypothetical protein
MSLVPHHRTFLDGLGKRLGIKLLDDWYKIKRKQILEQGGSSILNFYNGSPSKMVRYVYEEHAWRESGFVMKMPRGYWDKEENRTRMIRTLAKELQIEGLEEWYRISLSQICLHHRNVAIFRKYSLEKVLQETYPEHDWNETKLKARKGMKASQRWLKVLLQKLFPASGAH